MYMIIIVNINCDLIYIVYVYVIKNDWWFLDGLLMCKINVVNRKFME